MKVKIDKIEKIGRNTYLARCYFYILKFKINVNYTFRVLKDNKLQVFRIDSDDYIGCDTTEVVMSDNIAQEFRDAWQQQCGTQLVYEKGGKRVS